MKGDVVRIRYTSPGGTDSDISMVVAVGGRKLSIDKDKVWVTVSELTRSGTPVQSVQVRLDTITAIEVKGEDVAM